MRNHGFVDRNERTAWVVARLFLEDNGCRLGLDAAEAVRTVTASAARGMVEDDLARWLRERIVAS